MTYEPIAYVAAFLFGYVFADVLGYWILGRGHLALNKERRNGRR